MGSKREMMNFFPKSAAYRKALSNIPAQIREVSSPRAQAFFSERHLQCVWFDDALRPSELKDIYGEEVIVHDPGRWNLEKGPDFLGAVLEIRSNCRRVCGDVEIHIDPEDWNRHGHAKDPCYSQVCAHVSYLDKSLSARELPSNTLQINLKRPLQANPLFSFEDIDLSAYPFNCRTASPCAQVISGWSREMKQALLDSAGQERLMRKSERLLAMMSEYGVEQTVYMEVMRALGYKHNKPQFKRLAELIPLKVLYEESAGDANRAYAKLMGVAGLIPKRIDSRWDSATVKYLRSLWREWIRQQERWEPIVMSAESWNRSGTRPQNRIERRLAAAASIFSRHDNLAAEWIRLAQNDSRNCIENIVAQLRRTSFPYWDSRLAWSGRPSEVNVALLGSSRANAIATNVATPLIAASGACSEFEAKILDTLKPEPINSVVRLTAHTLFGPDHPPNLYNSSVRRQGLMQIFYDFCLDDKSGCSTCRLADILDENQKAWKSERASQD